jgi:hypothetical protein
MSEGGIYGPWSILDKESPSKNERKHFKGDPNTCPKPLHRLGNHVHDMVKDVKVIFGKGSDSQPIQNDENGRATMWKNKSIF